MVPVITIIATLTQGCLEDLEVRDIMTTDIISVRPEDSVYSAMDLMVAKSVSGLPVTGMPAARSAADHIWT